jgi:hypothetical protein
MSKKYAVNSFQLSIIIFLSSLLRPFLPDSGNEANPSSGIVGIAVLVIAIILNILFN